MAIGQSEGATLMVGSEHLKLRTVGFSMTATLFNESAKDFIRVTKLTSLCTGLGWSGLMNHQTTILSMT